MRDIAQALAIALVFSAVASATEVSVHVEKDTYSVGEEVLIQLVINPSKPVGGQLMVYQLSDGKYAIARLLYTKPTPEQCLTCRRDQPLSEYLNRTFFYQPDSEGDYVVEANFAGMRVYRNFTVGSTSTSTTTSLYTTTSVYYASSTLSPPATSSSTSSTTSPATSTSSLSRGGGEAARDALAVLWPYALFALLLAAAFTLASRRRQIFR